MNQSINALIDPIVVGDTVLTPVTVLGWACVGIFLITAAITLLAMTGVIKLPNSTHTNTLFRVLIVEIVVIGVGVFALNVGENEVKPFGVGSPGPENPSQGANLVEPITGSSKPAGLIDKQNSTDRQKTALQFRNKIDNVPSEQENKIKNSEKNCRKITVIDTSIFPFSSKIESIC